MTRPGSWRRADLPGDWHKIKAQVFTRDGGRCTCVDDAGMRCPGRPLEVDHIGDEHDHDLSNLRTLCQYHHRARTSRQANAAKRAKAAARKAKPPHPGLIDV